MDRIRMYFRFEIPTGWSPDMPRSFLVLPLFAIAINLTTSAEAVGQSKKKSPPPPAKKKEAEKAPAKITDKLKPWLDRLKESTPTEVKEVKKGEFVRTRNVPSDVKSSATTSDYADKPYVAKISWTSSHQDSKIFSDKEKAEKTD